MQKASWECGVKSHDIFNVESTLYFWPKFNAPSYLLIHHFIYVSNANVDFKSWSDVYLAQKCQLKRDSTQNLLKRPKVNVEYTVRVYWENCE
jgi:hypothetical protein